ncbi:HXXEE domain-containing protein [Methanobacterium formicicum]|uniref:Putative membrane protein n=1 Tax=Methanobacterium formicicum TaxID=2162 RepID=A0A090I8F7_METFO|nr:HXXEE domain-containing protein [Methanobacterium formicicum]MDH2658539.1 HXXEE domain-containing protein [Methanobacterium formicicum]CEA14570.1 putative membrane protein [Methanobacterium formicicum]
MDLTILWLVPVAYFIHILEESPRFVPWAIKYIGAPETFGQFVIGNVIFMAYVIIATSLAIFYPSELTLVIGLSSAAWIFSNFLIHAYYTLRTGEYSPGVVTASAIYVPVSLYIYYNFLVSGMLNNLDLVLSIIIGFAVMYVNHDTKKEKRKKIGKPTFHT